MDDSMLTPADVAAILNVSPNTARALIRTMPHIKIGGRYRLRREVLEKYILRKERPQEPTPERQPRNLAIRPRK